MHLSKFLTENKNYNHNSKKYDYNDLSKVISAISYSAIEISKIIYSPQSKDLGRVTGVQNSDGDFTKSLDLKADEIIKQKLKNNYVKWYASEEEEEILMLNDAGSFALCVDPLDGSSNIETNAPIGTIFGLYTANSNPLNSILQKGENLISSGFFIYGPRTIFVLTLGKGTVAFQLSDSNEFILINKNIKIPNNTSEFSINSSNYNSWPNGIKEYIEICLDGENGIYEKKYNMRWVGSLVADAFRILVRGGVFLYPQDNRKGHEKGRLRLVYEANPVSYLIEQARGVSINGINPILSLKPKTLHERIPLIFGSKDEISKIKKIMEK